MKKVFVDGHEGTTGLMIMDRLRARDDIELIEIPGDKRKDREARRERLNDADLAILCLPDEAAKESVGLIENPRTKVIDASTAHRTSEGWVYGLPELDREQRGRIRTSRRVTVPGCYATGFVLAVRPLVSHGIVPEDYPITVHAVSGYSGGGKKLINVYENRAAAEPASMVHRPYALGLEHKHVPEMQKWTGLAYAPLFAPSVGDFYKGMLVSIPLLPRLLRQKTAPAAVRELLGSYYASEPFVRVMPLDSEGYLDNGYLSATACNNTNMVEIFVFGHAEQILIVSRLDNLGKGSSGAAVQNMNIMLGLNETKV